MTLLHFPKFSRLSGAVLAAALVLTGCDAPAPRGQTFVQPNQPQQQQASFSVAPPNAPSGPVVDSFAVNFLNSIQAQSIAERREYCGYIFIGADGFLQATQPRAGNFASCDMPAPRRGQGIIASYHTHGAYGRGYDNEVPSAIDLVSAFDYGLDGYVSTPGGRVWLVDFQTLTARQLCGLGCVTSDPGYRPQGEAGIRQSFTLPEIQQRSGQF